VGAVRIGIDFDNTIVCYDEAFYRAARERDLIPADVTPTKSGVRDWLRAAGREDDWTELQGHIYGARMELASVFSGVRDFMRAAREAGCEIGIVSHKTRHPYRGKKHDLHQAALGWLTEEGFFDDASLGLRRSQVFLELTKDAKLARIGALGCDYFVDDLPELLAEPGFPAETGRVLFDPNDAAPDAPSYRRARSWREVSGLLLGRPCSR
jgi:alkylhydroperoxidase family enzyme